MSMSAILLKLQPNQDITVALEEAVAAAGLEKAGILAAVGSLTQGVVIGADGFEIVEGPAIEVAALSGEIKTDGSTQLHGYLCCADTTVVEGVLARGCNGIAVTFEVLLQDATGAQSE
jgi:predicted DNA-binding protein with PD1-like motif